MDLNIRTIQRVLISDLIKFIAMAKDIPLEDARDLIPYHYFMGDSAIFDDSSTSGVESWRKEIVSALITQNTRMIYIHRDS